MKVLFICGSLEPGRDGVGDYSRLLAAELIRQGQQASIIALNERNKDISTEEMQDCEGIKLDILRLSAKTAYSERFAQAQKWVDRFNPDWLSLQYVPFSFQKKGLPFRLAKRLKKLGRERKWHIMFHESWVLPDSISLYRTVSGAIQKKIIRNTVKRLNPLLINTSNPFYRDILKTGKISSTILPLPGNIPVSNKSIRGMNAEFETLGIKPEERNNWRILGTFGSLRPGTDLKSVLYKEKEKADLKNNKLAFFSIGRTGKSGEEIISDLRKEFKESILIHTFKERSSEDISAFFQSIDIGVSAVPSWLQGKSGSCSAMRLHKLEILFPDEINREKAKNGFHNAKRTAQGLLFYNYHPAVIAREFITQLHCSGKTLHKREKIAD